MITFKGIIDEVAKWGAGHGLPVFFGDEYTRNVLANNITGDFIFVDVPGGVQPYNDLTYEDLNLNILIQVLGTSRYLRDDMAEIDLLDRTFTVITDISRRIGCAYSAANGVVTKRQNIYDSPKSGWELTIAITV